MKSQPWLSALLLCGCAHAPQPHSPAPNAPPSAPVAAETKPALAVASLGLQVRLPSSAELFEFDTRAADGPVRTQGVGCTVDGQTYYVARYFRAGRDRPKDEALLKNLKGTLKTVSREIVITHGEWPGIELEGTDERGRVVWRHAIAIGDGFWLAEVQRSAGAFDRAAARAFFDSLVFGQPWSVHAFPEGHFSALMPDGGVLLGKQVLHSEDYTVAQLSWLGGTQARAFGVWSIPLEGDATPDERMERASQILTDDGSRMIWQAPVVVDDARGRDFLTQKSDTWTRIRVVVTATELYMLQATARTKDALLDESVPRFFDSLRWY